MADERWPRKFGTGKGESVEGHRERGSRESEMPLKCEEWKMMMTGPKEGNADWEGRNGVHRSQTRKIYIHIYIDDLFYSIFFCAL